MSNCKEWPKHDTLQRTLRNLEEAYATIASRPIAYPYRPGTIPKATKARKLAKLAKDIAEAKTKLTEAWNLTREVCGIAADDDFPMLWDGINA